MGTFRSLNPARGRTQLRTNLQGEYSIFRAFPAVNVVAFAFLTLNASRCSDARNDANTPPAERIAQSVVGAARAALQDDGRFALVTPVRPNEITAIRAQQLALAWAKDIGPQLRNSLEEEHDAKIDFAKLRPCGRVFYADTPFEPVSADIPLGVRRWVASHWLVGLCGPNGELTVSLAVAALATDLEIVGGSLGLSQPDGGNEFFAMGVPADWDSPVGLSPERAVAQLAEATGKRVTAVPTLLGAAPAEAYPQGAVWRLDVESPASLKTLSNRALPAEATVYVGLANRIGARAPATEPQLNVPTLNQPDEFVFQYLVYPAGQRDASVKPEIVVGRARRRAGAPVGFEYANAERGN